MLGLDVTAALQVLIEQAMSLPEDERAELATVLLRSLEPDDEPELTEAEWQADWAAELERRAESVRNGTATLVDGDEAMRAIRAKLTPRTP